ncbi:hypothetical protein MSG28_004007 [Choristoneura fumiferana]|uniref:Uncharacterized protein n=1 Tax=Choristoneura fumiferana TaxID=7141 RepID=A0ACC0KH43_CHOFU|nr:hypothetical protein MSG28_004007 [Choristoneura fumiferana]
MCPVVIEYQSCGHPTRAASTFGVHSLSTGGLRVGAALTTSGLRIVHEFPSGHYGGEQRAITEWSTRRPRVATSRVRRTEIVSDPENRYTEKEFQEKEPNKKVAYVLSESCLIPFIIFVMLFGTLFLAMRHMCFYHICSRANICTANHRRVAIHEIHHAILLRRFPMAAIPQRVYKMEEIIKRRAEASLAVIKHSVDGRDLKSCILFELEKSVSYLDMICKPTICLMHTLLPSPNPETVPLIAVMSKFNNSANCAVTNEASDPWSTSSVSGDR